MVTTKAATEIAVGDQVVERDGAVLTVAAVERVGRSVVMVFSRYGSVPCGHGRVRASAQVRVMSAAVAS